jgi:hypothetical protein
MKEEARQTAAREADLPAIFHKTWQAEYLAFLLGRVRRTSACHWSLPFRPAQELRRSVLHSARVSHKV